MSLAARIGAVEPTALVTYPLRDVVSWERCGVLQVQVQAEADSSSSLRAAPLVRLNIGPNGIDKVERLACRPLYKAQCIASSAFVVAPVNSVVRVTLQLKTRQTRQSGYDTGRGCTGPSPRHHFLLRRREAIGVHSHRADDDGATPTYEYLSRRRRQSMAWIYLPIARADRVLVLGVREQPQTRLNILVRMQLAGDVVIGMPITGGAKNLCLGRSAPVTLIHGEPKEGFPVPCFGAYCRLPAPVPTDTCLPPPFTPAPPCPSPVDGDVYFSWAPLDGIASAHVFSDPASGYCRGILLQYRDGGERSLGQCRLQVDPVAQVIDPRMLCYRIELCQSRWRRTIHRAHAYFRHDALNSHDPRHTEKGDGSEWKYYKLKGSLQFWFTDESSFLMVVNE